MCGNCSVKIHKVNISQLQDCSVVGSETNFQMENSPIDKTTVVGATNSHKDQNFFADYILEQGFHFFIGMSMCLYFYSIFCVDLVYCFHYHYHVFRENVIQTNCSSM